MDTTKSEVYLTMEKETLVKIIDNKRECIKMLKQRIDKAIEYIEKNTNVFPVSDNEKICLFDTINASPKELLDILKGSDSND